MKLVNYFRRSILEKQISPNYQHDLFDESAIRWHEFPAVCHKEVELFVKQLLIQAIEKQSVTINLEDNNAS